MTALSSTVQLALYLLKIAATTFAASRLGSSRATWPTRPSSPIYSAASARVSCTRGLASVSTVAAFYRRLNAREGILYLRPGVHDRRSTFVLAIPAARISGSPAKSSCGLTVALGVSTSGRRSIRTRGVRLVPAFRRLALLSPAARAREDLRPHLAFSLCHPSPASSCSRSPGFLYPASFMWLLNTSAALAQRLLALIVVHFALMHTFFTRKPFRCFDISPHSIPDACFPPPLLSLHGRVLIPAVFTHCRPFLLLSLREGVLVPTTFAFGPAVSSFRYSAVCA
ncbi:hypothetical protein C8J57DRAFT_1732257 [Mycena rebaudengoi]|nr:hypothetical protein C8J57DRAFT_1732257 [Mycena rebaudengoi]